MLSYFWGRAGGFNSGTQDFVFNILQEILSALITPLFPKKGRIRKTITTKGDTWSVTLKENKVSLDWIILDTGQCKKNYNKLRAAPNVFNRC